MPNNLKPKNMKRKPSPLVGEGVNRQVDGRGKCEQKPKNGISKMTAGMNCISK